MSPRSTPAGSLRAARRIPVMVRGGGGHAPSRYRVYARFETFQLAAAVVQKLRRNESVAWAYIPDEYADMAE